MTVGDEKKNVEEIINSSWSTDSNQCTGIRVVPKFRAFSSSTPAPARVGVAPTADQGIPLLALPSLPVPTCFTCPTLHSPGCWLYHAVRSTSNWYVSFAVFLKFTAVSGRPRVPTIHFARPSSCVAGHPHHTREYVYHPMKGHGLRPAWITRLYSSVAEHWSCKPGVGSSILPGGFPVNRRLVHFWRKFQ